LDYGYIGVPELLFFFLIVILVVGPRRIWRGYKVIRQWVSGFFQRLRGSKAAKQGRGILRGLGKMLAYYSRERKDD
jgi:Sec-independent protein translocase protein TatA